jgi:hypothetical protein
MSEHIQRELTIELARHAVHQVAPGELPLFRSLSERYIRQHGRDLRTQAPRDELLGFGAGEAVALLTPIAFAIAAEVVGALLVEFKERLAERGADKLVSELDGLLARVGLGGDDTLEFTQKQRDHVRAVALAKACELGLSPERARLLADAIVGALHTSNPPG